MCGRFTLRARLNLLLQEFSFDSGPELFQRFNIAPSQDVLIIRQTENGRSLAQVKWGLVPSWATDPKIGYSMINARSETAAEKPSFRSAMKARRCLIPADGFYEWAKVGKQKQPHLFHRPDEKPFEFAGLWERWSKVDPPLKSCTILTSGANEMLAKYHDRMPVILSPNDYDKWIDPANKDPESLKYLFEPLPASELIDTAVNPVMNNARHEGPDCGGS